jgi:tetratricopeptide (TPR) repeat protein
MSKYKIQNDWFYYYLGLAYYDKRKWDRSLYYYDEAIKVANTLQKDIHRIYNSIGTLETRYHP